MNATELPTPYLFLTETPILYYNGRLFQPGSLTLSETDSLLLGKERYSLEEIVTPKALEDLYLRHNREAVHDIEAAFIRKTLDSELMKSDDLRKTVSDNKVLALIIDKILPIITSETMDRQINSFLSEDAPPKEEAPAPSEERIPPALQRRLDQIKSGIIEKINEEYGVQRRNTLDDRITDLLRPSAHSRANGRSAPLYDGSALNEMLGRNNLLIMENKAYSLETVKEFLLRFRDGISDPLLSQISRLSPAKAPAEVKAMLYGSKECIQHKYFSRMSNKVMGASVNLEGMHYIPIYSGKASELEGKYKRILEKHIKIDAVENSDFQARQLHSIAKEKARLEDIARRSSFEKNGAGFARWGDQYIVYIKTPPYALKSPHIRDARCYMPFEPAKIGCIIHSSGQGFCVHAPIIMHDYKHPFLGNAERGKELCLGSWANNAGDLLKKLPPEQRALTLLNQGKKTLMMGYRSGSNPYKRLMRDEWSGWITKKETEQRGLVCLNEYEG